VNISVSSRNLSWIDKLRPGWRDLYRKLIWQLALVDPTLEVVNAKEMRGELLVRLDRSDQRAETLIRIAQIQTRTACTVCGKPAQPADRSGGVPLCDNHATSVTSFVNSIDPTRKT
jgi:hypothetical protein